MRFTVRAPASSANLGPGFDAIGLALDLWNEVTVDTEGEANAVLNEGAEAALLAGRENLTLRAMRTLAEEHGRFLPPFAVTTRTEIPIARGLGSSAAALVAGLVAANHLLDLGLTDDELYAVAWRIEGHGDNVGAAIYGGAILAVPNVRRSVRLWAGEPLGLTAVVFIPEATGATWAARAALPAQIPHADATFNVATAAGLTLGLRLRDHELIAAGMHDRLHEPYRARLFPHLDAMRTAALHAGALGACLSGAGPTVLALVPPDHAAAVGAAFMATAQRLQTHGRARELQPTIHGVSGPPPETSVRI
ncbi:MAG: homoserine kinase [Chloroflexia bacterium]|nr:homoserine kinase [Chloroflexia bacterium]